MLTFESMAAQTNERAGKQATKRLTSQQPSTPARPHARRASEWASDRASHQASDRATYEPTTDKYKYTTYLWITYVMIWDDTTYKGIQDTIYKVQDS